MAGLLCYPRFMCRGSRGLAAHLHHNRTEARILIMTSEERREARYHRRKAARENRRRRRSEALGGADQALQFPKNVQMGKEVLQQCEVETIHAEL